MYEAEKSIRKSLYENLWQGPEKSLIVDLLTKGDYVSYRNALARGKKAYYQSMTSVMNNGRSTNKISNGCVVGHKTRIADPSRDEDWAKVFRDHVIISAKTPAIQAAMQKSMERKVHVFVMIYICNVSGCKPEDIPLGMFCVVQATDGTKAKWKLEGPVQDSDGFSTLSSEEEMSFSGSVESLSLENLEEEGGAKNDPYVAISPEVQLGEEETPPADSAYLNHQEHIQARPFRYNGEMYDSKNEFLHIHAFKLMGLKFNLLRSSFDIERFMPSEFLQKTYTPDGVLWVRLGDGNSCGEHCHVEIKPGRLNVQESFRAKALCKATNQKVLCVYGPYVTNKMLADAEDSAGNKDFFSVRVENPVSMSIYVPKGPEAEPEYYPHVVWRFSEEGEAYLSVNDDADPLIREDAHLRVIKVYQQATQETHYAFDISSRATSSSCRSSPYGPRDQSSRVRS